MFMCSVKPQLYVAVINFFDKQMLFCCRSGYHGAEGELLASALPFHVLSQVGFKSSSREAAIAA